MIPIASPALWGNERRYVLDCLDRVELSGGSYVRRFEEAFAAFCEVRHALACANGTAALHLALLALGLQPGERVLVPALTYVATANAVRYCGATSIVCDVDPQTWCLDPQDAERRLAQARALEQQVVGILPVHLYGQPADMTALRALAARHSLWCVEDAAEAHGARYGHRRVGSLGDLGTFSFYGNKMLTCGEGGMVTTDDDDLAARVALFRGQGMDPSRRYWHPVVGHNYRLTNLQAAVGLAQLETYVDHLTARQRVNAHYRRRLASHVETQGTTASAHSVGWMFSVLVPPGVSRDGVMAALDLEAIETRPLFVPLTQLPMYRGPDPPVAADLGARGLSLPTHASLTEEEVDRVCDALLREVGRCA